MESEIEELPVFRRLRGIKQLGLTNWIFPGAEHTRYSHSLGVMHIADEMAKKLCFSPTERQLIRVASMLHDIGHYPLSHVGERAYKRQAAYALKHNIAGYAATLRVQDEADPFFITHTLMRKSSDPFHHETVGVAVIRKSIRIRAILEKYDINIDDVCAIITGDISNPKLIKYIQILHSEMDADRIDYLLRDTFSSGTAYGSFEINTLIKNLEMARHSTYDADIIGVNAKGIMSADQFLLNRYFAYTQVFFHKHVTALTTMCEAVMAWALSCGVFPKGSALLRQIDDQDKNDDYFNFTDSFFMEMIKRFAANPDARCPAEITCMISRLAHFLTPDIAAPPAKHNIIISGKDNRILLSALEEAAPFEDPPATMTFSTFNESFLTRHVRLPDFVRVYNERAAAFGLGMSLDDILMHRLINGVAFIDSDNSEIRLLHDSNASLVKDLCRHRTLFLRTYDIS